jgi:ADP-heptose:LPS heptosyltransferase
MHHFKRTYSFQFLNHIPNTIEKYIESTSLKSRYLKFFKRRLYIFLKGQKDLELFTILTKHKNILWINMSAASLGDSLMDLSSRIMLRNKKVDLFTHRKNFLIYEDDLFFSHVFTNIQDLAHLKYDLIIIDSYSTRSIKIKSIVARETPYVGMFGYFNGPEVNRTLFSFSQMNNLLDNIMNEYELKDSARNSISVSKNDKEVVKNITPKNFIAFVLGGEWKFKTFHKWEAIVSKISFDNPDLYLVFLGSKNATSCSEEILKKFPNRNILNFVNKLTFNQTAEVISRSELVFCCDGGLMHAANAVSAKNISLFAKLSPEMLITDSANSYHLFDENNVNNISTDDILSIFGNIYP